MRENVLPKLFQKTANRMYYNTISQFCKKRIRKFTLYFIGGNNNEICLLYPRMQDKSI